jgi:hypothetical protein
MNETFNMNRFRLLAWRQWSEHKKVYLLLWGMISFALIVLALFSEKYDMGGYYLLLFCFGGCMMATTLFSQWTDFGRSSLYLLLPASVTEKFLCGLVYGIILYIPLYALNFLLFRYLITYLLVMPFENGLVPFSTILNRLVADIASVPHLDLVVLLAFLFIQSVFLISMIRFRKRQVLIFLLIVMAIVVVHNIGMRVLMSGLAHIPPGTRLTPGILIFFDPGFGYEGSAGGHPVSEYFAFVNPVRYLNSLIWFVVFTLLYLAAWSGLRDREL